MCVDGNVFDKTPESSMREKIDVLLSDDDDDDNNDGYCNYDDDADANDNDDDDNNDDKKRRIWIEVLSNPENHAAPVFTNYTLHTAHCTPHTEHCWYF